MGQDRGRKIVAFQIHAHEQCPPAFLTVKSPVRTHLASTMKNDHAQILANQFVMFKVNRALSETSTAYEIKELHSSN